MVDFISLIRIRSRPRAGKAWHHFAARKSNNVLPREQIPSTPDDFYRPNGKALLADLFHFLIGVNFLSLFSG
jgi:hypothetical protein